MDSLRVSSDFCFNESEEKMIDFKVSQIVEMFVRDRITYAQAVETLERSKIEMQKLFISRY